MLALIDFMTNADQSPLEQILAQSQTLYSPPEVALEIVRLTETDEVDLRADSDLFGA